MTFLAHPVGLFIAITAYLGFDVFKNLDNKIVNLKQMPHRMITYFSPGNGIGLSPLMEMRQPGPIHWIKMLCSRLI
jgi:hypothetical protein